MKEKSKIVARGEKNKNHVDNKKIMQYYLYYSK